MYFVFEALCAQNGVTPYRVGKETGISTSTLSDWKNGKSSPKQDKLKLIADFFGVSVDYLITGMETEYFKKQEFKKECLEFARPCHYFEYERYRKLRDLRGLRDADIARMTGITKSSFSDWKSGKSKPNADKVFLIAKALGTTVEYLMTGEKPEIPGFEPEHLELIELYSKLNKEQKSAILNMMRSFALSD